jgi:hypothetical protein
MEAICSTETLVSTRRYNPQDQHRHLQFSYYDLLSRTASTPLLLFPVLFFIPGTVFYSRYCFLFPVLCFIPGTVFYSRYCFLFPVLFFLFPVLFFLFPVLFFLFPVLFFYSRYCVLFPVLCFIPGTVFYSRYCFFKLRSDLFPTSDGAKRSI